MSTLKWAYLHNSWSKSHDQGTIEKLRSSTSHDPANPKRDSHTVRCHITNNHELPNIAMVFEPTVHFSRGIKGYKPVKTNDIFLMHACP